MLAIHGRQVDVLVANAGHSLGHGFLDKPFAEYKHAIKMAEPGPARHRNVTG